MKIATAVILASLMMVITASATVQTLLFPISETNSYTIPPGKVLIIENVYDHGGNLNMFLTNGTSQILINSPDFDNTYIPTALHFPLKIPEGWTIYTVKYADKFWIFASLVDTSDLYASVPSKIERIAVEGQTASLTIQTASARPTRISVERSPKVDKGWEVSTNAVISSTTSKTRYVATVPVAGQTSFFRAKAVQQVPR